MAVDDLWHLKKRGPDGKPLRSKRYGRGKRWRVRFVDPDTGEEHQPLFDKKSDAEHYDVNMRADISRGQYVDPRAGKVTLADYWQSWLDQQLHDVTTANLMERSYRLHVLPVLGHLTMSEVRPGHLRKWVKDRADVLGASTIHLVYGYIRAMFHAAVLDRVIGVSPCTETIQLPEIEQRERYIPTAAEVHAIAAELHPEHRAIPYLVASCGLRPSEVFGLELGHVDFLRREVSIVQQTKHTTKHGTFLDAPKTKTSRRKVELPTLAAETLARHIEQHPPVALDIADRSDLRDVHKRSVKLLFTTRSGGALYGSPWSSMWSRAVKRAKLPAGFGLHGLRHYYATLLIHNGASVKTVQLALGHSSPTITLNSYLHEWPDAVDRTRSLVDAALGTSMPTTLGVAQ